MHRKIWSLQFVQGVGLQFIDLLKNNGIKYFLSFDDSREDIGTWKPVVEVATAGRHQSLSTFCIKHHLFRQSTLGRNDELENTHFFLRKHRRDVMQVNMLLAESGPGLELTDWYWDATSVPDGHFLVDLTPRTDLRLRYCWSSGPVPSKIFSPDRLKNLMSLHYEHTKSLYSPSVPIIFMQCKSLGLHCCPKQLNNFLRESIVNLLIGNLQTTKRYHVVKFQCEVWLLSLKWTA